MNPQCSPIIKTLLLTDLVSSTAMIREAGDIATANMIREHDRIARDILQKYAGEEIDKSDGFLFVFDRPILAVLYALEYHQALRDFSQKMQVDISARAGIHLGEVYIFENSPEDIARGAKRKEVEGLAKPTAARFMSLAIGEQTLLSKSAYEIAKRAAIGHEGFPENTQWVSHGLYCFKGLDDPMAVYEVGIANFAPLTAPPDTDKAWKKKVTKISTTSQKLILQKFVPGHIINNKFKILEFIGSGAFGVVYRVAHLKMPDKTFALKIINPNHAQNANFRERFTREMKTAIELNHENIIQVYEFDETQDEELFFSMYFSQGETLATILNRESYLEESHALAIVKQILQGAKHAHRKNVVHRDLKPDNIIVEKLPDRERALILDFGIAKAYGENESSGSNLTEENTVIGTAAYMSPEQASGKSIDARSDLYSIGVILYEMVSGKPPYTGNTSRQISVMHITSTAIRPSKINKNISSQLDKIIAKAMTKNRDNRYQSADEFMRDIDDILEGKTAKCTYLGKIVLFISLLSLIFVATIAWHKHQRQKQDLRQKQLQEAQKKQQQKLALDEMEQAFLRLSTSTQLPEQQIQHIRQFLTTYKEDKAYSTKDNELRQRAQELLQQLLATTKQKSITLQQMQKNFAKIHQTQNPNTTIRDLQAFLEKYAPKKSMPKKYHELREKAQELLTVKTKDRKQQFVKFKSMQKAFAKLKKNPSITLCEKFLHQFSQDNPYTRKDNELRKKVQNAIVKIQKRNRVQKKRWEQNLQQMRIQFDNIEKNANFSIEDKITKWTVFLRTYKNNNPFSREDDLLRKKAQISIKKLTNLQKTWLPILQNMTSSFEKTKSSNTFFHKKIAQWQTFLERFNNNIPISNKDEEMRGYARSAIQQIQKQIQQNSQYKVTLICNDNLKTKQMQQIISAAGFQVDILPIASHENVCMYYSKKTAITNDVQRKLAFFQHIFWQNQRIKLTLEKIDIANKEHEIKIKFSDK